MSVVNFGNKPVGVILGGFYSEDRLKFSASVLEISGPIAGQNGLVFQGFDLKISLEQRARFVRLQLYIFNPTAIEALDADGIPVSGGPIVFSQNVGLMPIEFNTVDPVIDSIRIVGGSYENLLIRAYAQ